MPLTKAYEIQASPSPAMEWAEYERRVLLEWNGLLESDASQDEREIHRFLERHPCMIPGAYSFTGKSGHAPLYFSLFTESSLQGLDIKVPDFIWLAKDSATFTPVFIEIEAPAKPWFTRAGNPTHFLTQALGQLADWRAWLNQPVNHQMFYQAFNIPQEIQKYLTFRPEFVLIYGRRAEFDPNQELLRKRHQFERDDQRVMTFDRLKPDFESSFYIWTTKRQGRIRAVSFPATLCLGPGSARELSQIDGLEEAIRDNDWIPDDRKTFLEARIPYWNNWAANGARGVIQVRDCE